MFLLLFIQQEHVLRYTLFHIPIVIQSCPVQPQCWRLMQSTEAGWDEGIWSPPYLWLPAVTLFSLLHVAVAALLATVEHLYLRHVVQTHAHAFLQTGSKVLLTACTEHCWEWIPTRRIKEQG